MRPIPLLLTLLLLHTTIVAQNLIPNPDFESIVLCPYDHGQVSNAVAWKSATNGTSDYFNSCAGTACAMSMPWVCVPENWTGIETPHSGNAYMGFFAHWNPSGLNYREYIQCPLTEPLEAGVTYEISCYVSLGDDSQFATDGIGFVLTNDSIYGNHMGTLNYTPQVTVEEPVTEKDGWTKVTGCFTAVGGERYCTIGNFFTDVNTTYEQVPGGGTLHSYYYVDDVSLTRSEEFNPGIANLGPDVEGCEGDTLTLNVTGNIVWQDGSTASSYTITESGVYWVSLTTGFCTWTDTLLVELLVCEEPPGEEPGEDPPGEVLLEMPNVFSPDGDGLNEFFVPLPYTGLSGGSMEICNRWGQTVFHTNDLHTGWDGSFGGTACAEGIYFWTVTGTDPNDPEKILHGFLTLVRD